MRRIKGIFLGEPMIYETCDLEEQMSFGEDFWFVSTKPEKLWRNIEWVGPISREAGDCRKPQRSLQVARFVFSAAIHPDESVAQRATAGIDRQESGCLGANCNASNAFLCSRDGAHDLTNDDHNGTPPVLRILLDPARSTIVRWIFFVRCPQGAPIH